jgi:hypothetical protein
VYQSEFVGAGSKFCRRRKIPQMNCHVIGKRKKMEAETGLYRELEAETGLYRELTAVVLI